MYKNKDNDAGDRAIAVSSMHTRGGSSSFLYFAATARYDVGSAGQAQEPGRNAPKAGGIQETELTYSIAILIATGV